MNLWKKMSSEEQDVFFAIVNAGADGMCLEAVKLYYVDLNDKQRAHVQDKINKEINVPWHS